MLQAEKIALKQAARQQLLAIREKELNYFVGNFNSFSATAAVMAGFTATVMTAVDSKFPGVSPVAVAIFHLSSVSVLGLSLHCILGATLISVWGPGLALRGPLGSMVKAVDGILKERWHVFSSFGLIMISFWLMSLSLSWLVMEPAVAIVSTFVLMIIGFFAVKVCLRMYKRFHLENDSDDIGVDWGDDTGTTQNAIGVAGEMLKRTPQIVTQGPPSGLFASSNKAQSTVEIASAAGASENCLAEGYLSKKIQHSLLPGMLAWHRRFFTLYGHNLYYYKTKEAFMSSKSAVSSRPIDLRGYKLDFSIEMMSKARDDGGAAAMANGDTGDLSDDENDDNEELEFCLQPSSTQDSRRSWEFRADTEGEFAMWVEALAIAIKSK